MGRYTGARCRISRRHNTDLGHKSGIRPFEEKCRQKTPGMHMPKRARGSDYQRQLRMKQMVKHCYNLREGQLLRIYRQACRLAGQTGENMLKIAESRLDNVVYRAGFAVTRADARQLVSHKAICVNGSVVSCPSMTICPGDVVSVRSRSQNKERIQFALSVQESKEQVSWLNVDRATYQASMLEVPNLDLIPADFSVNLVVELYSK